MEEQEEGESCCPHQYSYIGNISLGLPFWLHHPLFFSYLTGFVFFAICSGITSAQATLRDHAGTLEAELANREYSLGQLSSQTANVLAEKLAEDEAVGRKVT